MNPKRSPSVFDEASISSAIHDLLIAEQQAVQAVAACQKEAEIILERAQIKGAGILAKADLKVSDIQKECSKKIRKQEEELKRDNQHRAAFDLKLSKYDALLVSTVTQLAARVTGGENCSDRRAEQP